MTCDSIFYAVDTCASVCVRLANLCNVQMLWFLICPLSRRGHYFARFTQSIRLPI